MNLVAYSDSEESDTEAPPAPKPAAKPAPKPAFQKVVDRSNPGRIKLNIQAPKLQDGDKGAENAEPPTKKARTGGGGFNAMLPAPKKANAAPAAAPQKDEGATTGKKIFGNGFKPGVSFSFKTSAQPTFVRDGGGDTEDYGTMPSEPKPASTTPAAPSQPAPTPAATKSEPAPTSFGSLKFVPLSVARARKQKKPSAAPAAWTVTSSSEKKTVSMSAEEKKPEEKPKVSLFSISQEDEDQSVKAVSDGQYQPLLYGVPAEDEAAIPDDAFTNGEETNEFSSGNTVAGASSGPTGPQTLNDIASSLNLSESEKRQLFGRKRGGPDPSAAKIVEFNTDAEYAHNEKLRAAGETIQHNALRSITGTGKNSLRSLVNTATNQKDALEEHFAQGRRNKKEAGNKYGW